MNISLLLPTPSTAEQQAANIAAQDLATQNNIGLGTWMKCGRFTGYVSKIEAAKGSEAGQVVVVLTNDDTSYAYDYTINVVTGSGFTLV